MYLPDDGRTIYSMEGLSGGKAGKKDRAGLTRAEKWAAIRAALAHFTPILLLVIGCFLFVGLMMYFWLH